MIEFVPNMDSSMGDPGIINRYAMSWCIYVATTGIAASANRLRHLAI